MGLTQTKNVDLGKLGRQKFCRFCRTIRHLVAKRKERVDLIVTAGNTGIAIGKFTEMIYERAGLRPPKQVNLPFYRFRPGHEEDITKLFDYQVFLPAVVRSLTRGDRMSSALFVDDEIGRGLTAVACFKLLNAALKKLGRTKLEHFVIVAEDHGFALPPDIPEILFIPYDTKTPGYNNVIFFMTPVAFEKPVIKVLGNEKKFPWKARTNLLLGLPVKQYAVGKPVFTDRPLKVATKRVKDFRKIQGKYQNYVRSLIRKCLQSTVGFPIRPKRRLGYTFRRVQEADLPLLKRWLKQKFVARAWPDRWQEKEWRKKIHSDVIFPHLVHYGKKPIGYIQAYQAHKVGGGWWQHEKPGTWGVDAFIGSEWFFGKGHRSAFIRAFVTKLFREKNAKKIITDPRPENSQAIHAFGKAGFRRVKKIKTPNGPAILMEVRK